jgi:hypothetical protein
MKVSRSVAAELGDVTGQRPSELEDYEVSIKAFLPAYLAQLRLAGPCGFLARDGAGTGISMTTELLSGPLDLAIIQQFVSHGHVRGDGMAGWSEFG